MKLAGAIFDLDGTLLDSMPYWETVGSRYLLERDIPIPDIEQFMLRLKTMTLPEAAEYYRQDFGVTEPEEVICAQISDMIEEDYRSHAPLKDGVREVLDGMRRRGVHMCVATATDRRLVEMALKRVDVIEYFDFILTCGDLNTSKNQPYIFDECRRRLGTPKEQTAIFEDSLHCVTTASRAGYPVVGVYDASAASEARQIRSLCCQYITNWAELGDKLM